MAMDPPKIGAPGEQHAELARAAAVAAKSVQPGLQVEAEPRPLSWKTNAVLFVLTVVSVFYAGAAYAGALHEGDALGSQLRALPKGWTFAVPLLAILLTHEFGHFFAARFHKVDVSLPYFLPLPKVSPFGTMGAVISMRGRIKSRNALLDIGASGPLAGLVVAIPVLAIGLAQSKVGPIPEHGSLEGQSLLYLLLKRVVLGPIPPGYDVLLEPTAMAGWTGLLVTTLNLMPIMQLDGGHIAYALFERRQHRYSRLLHQGLLVVFLFNFARFVAALWPHPTWDGFKSALGNSIFWLFWYGLLHLLAFVGGRDHPSTEPGALSGGRKIIALISLAFFVLLFMPTPWMVY